MQSSGRGHSGKNPCVLCSARGTTKPLRYCRCTLRRLLTPLPSEKAPTRTSTHASTQTHTRGVLSATSEEQPSNCFGSVMAYLTWLCKRGATSAGEHDRWSASLWGIKGAWYNSKAIQTAGVWMKEGKAVRCSADTDCTSLWMNGERLYVARLTEIVLHFG